MKSIFKKSLLLVTLTGMVVAPMQADMLSMWEKVKAANPFRARPAAQPTAPVQATAVVQEVPALTAPTSVAQEVLALPAPTSTAVVAPTPPAVPASNPAVVAPGRLDSFWSAMSSLKSGAGSVLGYVATPFVWAGNKIAAGNNWISEKSGYEAKTTGIVLGVTAAAVLSYCVYKLVSKKKNKSAGISSALGSSVSGTGSTSAAAPVATTKVGHTTVTTADLTAKHTTKNGVFSNSTTTAKELAANAVVAVNAILTASDKKAAAIAAKAAVAAVVKAVPTLDRELGERMTTIEDQIKNGTAKGMQVAMERGIPALVKTLTPIANAK